LIVWVMLVGSLVIGPAENEILERNSEATWKLIAGASYDVLALAVATVLSVFKPGDPSSLGGQRTSRNQFVGKNESHPAIICRQQSGELN